jgi:hypothetical protein
LQPFTLIQPDDALHRLPPLVALFLCDAVEHFPSLS